MDAATATDLVPGPGGARLPEPPTGPGPTGPGPSLAERIDTLFRTVHPPGTTRQFTYEEVADAIADGGGPTISASYLYMLRRGIRDNPTKRHLEALARFFGVQAGYFFDAAQLPGVGPSAVLRNPQVLSLASAAAAVSPASLQILLQTVELVADLERTQGGDPHAEVSPDRVMSGRSPDSPDRIELELARAELEIQSGRATEALQRLTTILDGRSGKRHRDHAVWLSARAWETLGQREQALEILYRMLDECLEGDCHLSVPRLGERICDLALATGDPRFAIRAGRRILGWVEQRGLGNTPDHLRTLSLLMRAHLETGESAAATVLAEQLISVAGQVPDLLQQATIYTDCAREAEVRGRLEEAGALAGQALAAVSRTTVQDHPTSPVDVARLKVRAAGCLIRQGPHQAEMGRRTLEGVREVMTEQAGTVDKGQWATELAAAHLALGEPREAEINARRALAMFGEPHPITARAHVLLGDALHAQGRHAYAASEHDEAGNVLTELCAHQPVRWTAMIWRALGERWQECGLHGQAAQAFQQALDLVSVTASDPTNRSCPTSYLWFAGVLSNHR